ncbi:MULTISPECIES: hypothetical protein [Cysteiniphilum]|uniref:Uncharacterized protein n=1 Tax=Cysteiniphilum litorale TaxID=2056700 RepID=A0A8J2Z3E9_9GAMM|nr:MULTISPECIES: hypothetical protein [Cysteiniphilum]GGF92465.1 hypothetical protein GCM10010995_07060 [Cysteiniphilum litorale]
MVLTKRDATTNYPIYLSALIRNYLMRYKLSIEVFAASSQLDKKFLQDIVNQKVHDLTRDQMIDLSEDLGIPVQAVVYPCEILKKDIESAVDAIYDALPENNHAKYDKLDPVSHLERMSNATEKALMLKGYKNIEDCIRANPALPKMVLHSIVKRKMSSMRADTLASISHALDIDPLLLAGIKVNTNNNALDNSNDDNIKHIPLYASVDELRQSKNVNGYIGVQGIQKAFHEDELKAIISQNTQHNVTISVITTPRFDPYTNTKHLYELSDGYIIEVSLYKSSVTTSRIEILDRVESITDEHKARIIGRLVTSITQYKATDKK